MPIATPNCDDVLRRLYNAIIDLQTGKKTTSISFGERSVSYTQANFKQMMDLYSQFYRTCGADTDLPDLSASALVERGRPFIVRF